MISCTIVQRLTEMEQQTHPWQQKMKQYDNDIEERIENVSNIELNTNEVPQWNRLANDENDPDFIKEYGKKISDDSIRDIDMVNAQDEYVNMEIGVPRGLDGELENIKVKKRALDVDGMPIGKANKNSILDTRAYEIEYGEGLLILNMPIRLLNAYYHKLMMKAKGHFFLKTS